MRDWTPARTCTLAAGVLVILTIGMSSWAAGEAATIAESENPPASAPCVATAAISPPTPRDTHPRDYPGIHNAVAFHEGFISGGVPEGAEGFRTLAAMGIKTIISVDGAEPDVELARKHGLRYIHLPIGYNGFKEDRKLELARATRDSIEQGPVYIHCHHGKHRSAGAAGAVAVSLGWSKPDEMVSRMKVSGTAPNYKGLYACTANATPVEARLLNEVSPEFPEVSRPTGYVKGMVEIDEVYENLKLVEKAGWVAPKDHPDLVPVAEAGRLADLYRILHDTDYAKNKPADFDRLMTESQKQAQSLEDMLLLNKPDPEAMSALFKEISTSCKTCHQVYRDE